MVHYNWDLDLPLGEEGEKSVNELLHGKIEVKTDFMVSETGNVVIEFESRGNPSGITTTEATWWAFVLEGWKYKKKVVVFVEKNRLFNLVRKHGEKVMGGDNKTSTLYKISLKKLLWINDEVSV